MKKLMRVMTTIVLIVVVVSLLGGASYYFMATKDLVLSESSLGYKESSVDIYSLNNQIINKSSYVDNYIEYSNIPDSLIQAFISIEDKRFYKHNGVDVIRIGGALVKNIQSKEIKEGASTISQQLIKNTHLTAEKSIIRKLQEVKLARELEKQYDKDEILEMYLNVIYFGNGIYGVQNAAQRFFNKDCSALTVSESAMLAGIVKNPSRFSPVNQYENSIERRNLVLRLMHEQDMIDSKHLLNAQEENIVIKYKALKNNELRPYINNTIREAAELLGINYDDVVTNNYKIYTYLDYNAQYQLANKIYNTEYYKANSNGHIPDGMGVIVDNYMSGIIAYCSTSPYSAYDVLRQPGSAIKPIAVYLPGLEHGIITAATQVLDEATTFNDYTPGNYNDIYYGWVSSRDALSKSLNIPAVKILSYVGVPRALNYMDRFRFNTVGENSSLALALGGTHNGATIIQMAAAYRAIADMGNYREISFIRRIEDSSGRVLYSHNTSEDKIISEENAYIMTDMLKSSVNNGTASKLSVLPYEIAAKTGTVASNNAEYNSDVWSMSYTSMHTIGIWQGNISNKREKMMDKSVTGGGYPTMLARDVYRDLYIAYQPQDFARPEGVITLELDTIALTKDHTLMLASDNTPESYITREIFTDNNKPKEISEYFEMPEVQEFKVYIEDNQPIIEFYAENHISYSIIRETFNSVSIIEIVEDTQGAMQIIDTNVEDDSIIKYTIYPSIVIDEMTSVKGKPSKSITIIKRGDLS